MDTNSASSIKVTEVYKRGRYASPTSSMAAMSSNENQRARGAKRAVGMMVLTQ
jgi:hypothetical protein